MLREFAQRLQQEARTPQQSGGGLLGQSPIGTLTDFELHLENPIQGEVNGEPVAILGEGNKVGFSPVSWCVDTSQENAWVPTELIRITDPRYQPTQQVTSRQPQNPREYSTR